LAAHRVRNSLLAHRPAVLTQVGIQPRRPVRPRALLATSSQWEPPVDVDRIAKELGLVLVKTDLPDDVSGRLIREDGSNTVGINRNHTVNRQRFTLSHEVGHFRLHRGRHLIVDSPVRINL